MSVRPATARAAVNPSPEPLLIEARLLTMARRATRPRTVPRPGAVACAAGRIVAVGTPEDCARRLPPGSRRIEAREATLLPGFIDAHVHILAAAAAAAGPDVSPRAVSRIAELLEALGEAAARTPPGQWVRASGYEETMLAEGRPPTRAELDRAVPGHPVRLIQRSGHAEVLNSRALALVGIDESTPEPPGALFGRSLEHGGLDGLLLGIADAIEAAMPQPDPAAVEARVREWAHARAAEGVTTLVDAGARNGPAEWASLERLLDAGAIPQRVVAMESADALGTLPGGGRGRPPAARRDEAAARRLRGRRAGRSGAGGACTEAIEAGAASPCTHQRSRLSLRRWRPSARPPPLPGSVSSTPRC